MVLVVAPIPIINSSAVVVVGVLPETNDVEVVITAVADWSRTLELARPDTSYTINTQGSLLSS